MRCFSGFLDSATGFFHDAESEKKIITERNVVVHGEGGNNLRGFYGLYFQGGFYPTCLASPYPLSTPHNQIV